MIQPETNTRFAISTLQNWTSLDRYKPCFRRALDRNVKRDEVFIQPLIKLLFFKHLLQKSLGKLLIWRSTGQNQSVIHPKWTSIPNKIQTRFASVWVSKLERCRALCRGFRIMNLHPRPWHEDDIQVSFTLIYINTIEYWLTNVEYQHLSSTGLHYLAENTCAVCFFVNRAL